MFSSKNSLIIELPDDIINYTSGNFLDITSASCLSRASKQFHLLFNKKDYWISKIAEDFDITPEMMIKLSKGANPYEYKEIYKRLNKLKIKLDKLPDRIRYLILDEENKFTLLFCCTDNADRFIEIINPEELVLWLEVSLYAGCINVPKLFLLKSIEVYFPIVIDIPIEEINTINKKTIKLATKANRADMVKFLFSLTNNLYSKPSIENLISAAELGNNELIDFYLNQDNKFELNVNECAGTPYSSDSERCALNEAIINSHFSTVKKLLHYGATPNKKTAMCITQTRSSEIVVLFLNKYPYAIPKLPNFGVKASADSIKAPANVNIAYLNENIAGSGNLSQLRNILENEDNKQALHPNQDTLFYAAGSGNLDMVKYLLNPANCFNLLPNHGTLARAVSTGNLKLVKHLLSPKNHYNIQVNEAAHEMSSGIAIRRIVLSHDLINFALNFLNVEDHEIQSQLEEAIKESSLTKEDHVSMALQKSFIASPKHYCDMIFDMLINPFNYNLSEYALDLLYNHVNELTNNRPLLTLINNNQIFMNNLLDKLSAALKDNEAAIKKNVAIHCASPRL